MKKMSFYNLKYPVCVAAMLLLMLACKQENKSVSEEVSYQEQAAADRAKPIKVTSREVDFLPETTEAINHWSAFLSLQNEMDKLTQVSYQNVMSNTQNLVDVIEETQKTIPDEFNVAPVRVRLTVMLTKAKVLHQQVENPRIKTETINELVNSIYQAYNNLRIQLNEVFIKSLEDIEAEFQQALSADSSKVRRSSSRNQIQNQP